MLMCISIHAQTNVGSIVPAVDSTFMAKLTGEFFYESKQYIGEQYFNVNWEQSDILLSTGEMIHNMSLKYNGLFDELIWMNSTNYGKFKLDRSFVREFWLKDEQGLSTHFKKIDVHESDNGNQPDVYVEIGIEGKISLYIHRKISVVGTKTLYMEDGYRVFGIIEATPVYYIKLPTNHYLKLNKIRHKAFLKLFPEEKKAIDKIIKANHLDVTVESDFVEVIKLMNKEIFR
jgi:hypothetical protein